MGNKIVLGPFTKGLNQFYEPFNIDNSSFPVLINAYQWRGRIKRKRGTSTLDRLQRFFNSSVTSYSSNSTITLDGSGNGNLLTGFSLETNGNIVPTTVSIVGAHATYTDPSQDGTLSPSGTINYSTGAITIAAEAGNSVTAQFNYYPSLPVMGLEDRDFNVIQVPGTVAFDTVYSYEINTSFPYPARDVSFYKNIATGTFAGYVQKTNWTPVRWNGKSYQQFWTVNYQGSLWATNGIQVPFSSSNVGLQAKSIVAVTVITPTTATLNISNHGLVVGDFVFVNEVQTTTGINLQTGYVTTVTDANNVIVTFPNAVIATNGAGGIAQYLTNTANSSVDCIRWYDGDPTNGNSTNPSFVLGNGWVNFMPPLSLNAFSIGDLPPSIYYLAGARAIVPFKDRLVFFGVIVQSATGSPIYLQDTIVYSQNGTPYYTASWNNASNNPTLANTTFNGILLPQNQTATPTAYFSDQTGFGGFFTIGVSQAINSVSVNEDVLIVGLKNLQTRMVYTGNDIVPFNFYFINSEFGSSSIFSAINLDKGVITKGDRAYVFTSQNSADRIDIEVPDQVFQVNLTNNGNERFCAQRDFVNEWIFFTYPSNETNTVYPNQTFMYNYRENTWSITNECYTTYGQFKRFTGYTWSTVGFVFPTWSDWNVPWDSGTTTLRQPELIAGNQQGFVIFRDTGTGEAASLFIQSFSGNTITSPDHCLNQNDYIFITNCTGTISGLVNNKIFQVQTVTQNTFTVNADPILTGTYSGNGVIERLYVPFIQTKQFPVAWEMGRKTRIGVQQYLLTNSGGQSVSMPNNGQITLLIFLSQNSNVAYNLGSIVPNVSDLINSGLIYSTVLYTCPESTNLGLTPPNINLQTPTAASQAQIWHRVNTSLIGDTVQLGFTLSDTQMTTVDDAGNFISQQAEIELHGCIIDVNPSQVLV